MEIGVVNVDIGGVGRRRGWLVLKLTLGALEMVMVPLNPAVLV